MNATANVTLPLQTRRSCPFLFTVYFQLIQTIVYSLLFIFSLVGNSLVIAVILRNRRLRTIINFFILNMAISDLLTPLFALTRRIKDVYLPYGLWVIDGVFGSITCKLVPFAEDTSIAVSVLTLEIIAVERFFSVVFPLRRQPIHSKKRCFLAIASAWLIGALFPSIYFYKYKIYEIQGKSYCFASWQPAFKDADAAEYEFTIFLVSFGMLPFIVLTSLYSAIVVSLHRQKANLHLAPEETQRRAKKHRRVTYMLMAVIAVFIMTWLPINVYGFLAVYVWRGLRPSCEYAPLVYSVLFLSYSYPAINPFIYYIFNESFRRGFNDLLCSYRCCRMCFKNRRLAGAKESSCGLDINTSRSVLFLSMRSLAKEQGLTNQS